MTQEVQYLRSINSVRDTTGKVFKKAVTNSSGQYFKVAPEKLDEVVEFLVGIVERDYAKLSDIPVHGRWQHLNYGGKDRMGELVKNWTAEGLDSLEISRRLIDLITFSVLVDAGAGNVWKFTEDGQDIGRSEGLAVASYHMFINGALSADASETVQGEKLANFTKDAFIDGFQISDKNPLEGFEGRLGLIQRLGAALTANPEIFGATGRPGNLIDYLYGLHSSNEINLTDLWDALMDGYSSIWPSGRLTVSGVSLGDCWVYKDEGDEYIVTFHKLTQWLCYSLLVPLEEYGYKFKITDKDLQTGLPEYRNGGLFYDFGVLELKDDILHEGKANSERLGYDNSIPTFDPDSGVIVEWRCLTIGLLDALLPLVNQRLNAELQLPQLIEAGTWKAGREIAAKLRPETNGPPINLNSDGTVF